MSSAILFSEPSIAFSNSKSFSEFFFFYQIVIVASFGFVGFCFGVTLVVVCMRRYVCFDVEEEERKPLALKAQDRVDAAQWGVKNALQLLIGLAIVGLSAAAVCTPVVTFPDGTNFYYLARCRGDICQEWKSRFEETCGGTTLIAQGGGEFCFLALIFAGTGGGLYVFIILIELFRRCCSDSCLGYDPDGDLGNPSKGYFPRWILLLLRILAYGFHVVAISFTILYVLFSMKACNGFWFEKVNMLTAGGSFGKGFYCLCLTLVFGFISILLDAVLGEVGGLVVLQPEDEIALKEIVAPTPKTIVPVTTTNSKNNKFGKNDNGGNTGSGSIAMPHPNSNNYTNNTADGDAKKLIQQQQLALDKMKKEMLEKEQFMLALQQKNLQQQQHLPSAAQPPSAQPQNNAGGVDPNFFDLLHMGDTNDHQQQHLQQNDHTHDAEQQNKILALQQLVQQLQHQHDAGTGTTATSTNAALPQQADANQALRPAAPQPNLRALDSNYSKENQVNPFDLLL